MTIRSKRRGEFTGRHMLAVLVVGFGIVMAVNFTMAGFARARFNGVVVENSYVASQHYNQWLEQAREQKALGWSADVTRGADGRLVVETAGVPAGAIVQAELRRPLGDPAHNRLPLIAKGADAYASAVAIPDGRWIVRLTITLGTQQWAEEAELA